MIFWKYIKGLNGTQYTWLEFQNSSARPTIKTNSTNNLTNATNWGSIVTTVGTAQTINTALILSNGLTLTGGTITATNIATTLGSTTTTELKTNTYKNSGGTALFEYVSASTHWTGASEINIANFHVHFAHQIRAEGDIKTNSKCEAVYFNTTSDVRAKEDVTLYNSDALDIVKAVQVHTFRYKDSKKPSLGMIAQDLVDYKFGDFSLVDNQEASGKNGDYMTIHESKLVYILWKAVQEQQELIESLYEQVNQLKKEA